MPPCCEQYSGPMGRGNAGIPAQHSQSQGKTDPVLTQRLAHGPSASDSLGFGPKWWNMGWASHQNKEMGLSLKQNVVQTVHNRLTNMRQRRVAHPLLLDLLVDRKTPETHEGW